jgi:hypothetical protein
VETTRLQPGDPCSRIWLGGFVGVRVRANSLVSGSCGSGRTGANGYSRAMDARWNCFGGLINGCVAGLRLPRPDRTRSR